MASCLCARASEQNSEKLAPLFAGLGQLHHPIITQSKEAQRYFDQGLTLSYAFNHKEAIRSFKAALAKDPQCAMAYWGVALAYGPHVNKPMSAEDNTNAWAALQKAIAHKNNASPKEQGYITALSNRYQMEPKEDRSELDKAYAAAMRELVKDYPDDLDAQTLFAEALMDTMPWDYWTRDRSPKPETEEILAALRLVMSRDPNHPGANHLYIHAIEAGPNPELGIPAADRLLNFAPQAGHLVHMPSHIYIRVGQYEDAIASNERAIKADQSYIKQCRAQGFYPGAYYPHNLHFLWYAQAFEGRSRDALKTAEKIVAYELDARCSPNPLVEAPRFRHLPWITAARFGRWNDVLNVPRPAATNSFLVDRTLWHFARGLAFAALNKPIDAEHEQSEMVKLAESDAAKALHSPQFPATNIFTVARHLLAGKIAGARGDSARMIAELEKAVATEDAIPYMEPAYWPFPTRPTLGAALIKAGQAEKAENVFRQDLKQFPRNGWGLFGLEQSLRKQGKQQSADSVRREFDRAWKHADVQLDLAWF